MTYIGISSDSRIEEKISWADTCFKNNEKALLGNKKIKQLIEEFLKASSESFKRMIEIGLVDECRECEEENRYSGTLLLINRLLGVKLPARAPDTKSCFFLGLKGCSLKARHVICVNYICKKITDRIPGHALNSLREKEGKELDTLFILNEKVKSVLRNINEC
jgi:hypothetical protein